MTDVQLRHEPLQARSRVTLERLRSIARSLYNEPTVGRDKITLGMIQEQAGVSIGTVYRYWADRIAMLDDIAPNRDQSLLSETVEENETEEAVPAE